jgi:formate-dependent nitrite reductase membrane component NrfD
MSPESQAPHWEWYYIAMYFYIGGISAGAYFIGSLVELLGKDRLREVSRAAYYLAFPLICITPVLLIADLGRPFRFWHLFYYTKDGVPYMNYTSPLSVGTWALLIYSIMSFLSFMNMLVADGKLTSPFIKKLHDIFSRIPHKVYTAVGSFFGFFVAGYTGVLLNTTSRPLWEATDPVIGALFIASAASTGAAAIAVVMAWQNIQAEEAFNRIEVFDRTALIIEFVLIALMVVVAGQYARPLVTGFYGILFLGGTVVLGIIIPLWLGWSGRRPGSAFNPVMLNAVLVLFGGALLRISLVQAGQMK